jgi:two-component system NarL family sensor kinase
MLVTAALLTAAVLLVTAVCAINGARRIAAPFPGFLVAYNRMVLSVARPGWPLENASRALFAQVVAVDGRAVDDARQVLDAASGVPVGTQVAYRLRRGADLFTEQVPTITFTAGDYVAIYGPYVLIGIVFSLTGFAALWWSRTGRREPVLAFFLLCQSVGLTLGTAGDAYGPYWFTFVYLVAQCLAIANLFHLAGSYPYVIGEGSRARRGTLAGIYLGALLLAVGLAAAGDDLSLFLPLLYAVYLLLANAIFVYATGLAIGFFGRAESPGRHGLTWALAGIFLVFLVPGTIFVIYPALERVIPPGLLVGPLVLFPALTGAALVRWPVVRSAPVSRSIRLRLSLLFLAAVETSFLVAVVVFWQSNSWEQLLADLRLAQRQSAAVERAATTSGPEQASRLRDIEARAKSAPEAELAQTAVRAAASGDAPGIERALSGLRQLYAADAERLEGRRAWIGDLDTVVLLTLLVLAALQAIGFTLAVRVWLISPIDRIAAATGVIATGDLTHRLREEPSEEFSSLAGSVNAMAASLQSIQRRIARAREARQRAAGAARDAERRRLARELHDGILQDLTAARLRLSAHDEEGDRQRALEEIARVIAAIRHVVDDLRPSDLGRVSLAEAIAGHARILSFGRGIELAVDLAGAGDVPDWAMRDLYRIAQEATANAVRHAGARRLAIRLVSRDGATVLEVEDDGAGFDPAAAAVGSGLAGMRERAAALGADLDIESVAGAGTRVRVTLRLAGEAA